VVIRETPRDYTPISKIKTLERILFFLQDKLPRVSPILFDRSSKNIKRFERFMLELFEIFKYVSKHGTFLTINSVFRPLKEVDWIYLYDVMARFYSTNLLLGFYSEQEKEALLHFVRKYLRDIKKGVYFNNDLGKKIATRFFVFLLKETKLNYLSWYFYKFPRYSSLVMLFLVSKALGVSPIPPLLISLVVSDNINTPYELLLRRITNLACVKLPRRYPFRIEDGSCISLPAL